MKKLRFIIITNFLLLMSLIIIFYLYPRIHPFSAINLDYNYDDCEKTAKKILVYLNEKAENITFRKSLNYHKPLIEKIYKQHGLQKENEILKNCFYGYYWSVHWHENNFIDTSLIKDKDSSMTTVSMSNTGDDAEYNELEFNGFGYLLKYKKIKSDTAFSNPLPDEDRVSKIQYFIDQFTPFQANIRDDSISSLKFKKNPVIKSGSLKLISIDRIIRKNKTVFQYNWMGNYALTDDSLRVSLSFDGNNVSEFRTGFYFPKTQRNYFVDFAFPIIRVVLSFIIGIFVVIFAFKKYRTTEIGFSLAIKLSIVIAFATSIHTVLSEFDEISWIIIFPVLFTIVFFCGSFIVLWAVGEAFGREEWKEKFITLDLISRGHIFHSRVSRNIISGVSYGFFTLAAYLSVMYVINVISPLYTIIDEEAFKTLFYHKFSSVDIISVNIIYVFFLITAMFVFVNILFRKIIKKHVVVNSILMVLFIPFVISYIKPISPALFINFLPAAIITLLFIKKDIGTAIIGFFTFSVFSTGWVFLLSSNAYYLNSGIILMVIFGLLLLIGLIGMLTRDHVVDFDKIAPIFVKYISERQRMQKELEIAREVQMSFLPKCTPDFSGLDICAVCEPALETGGDYYDFINLGDQKYGILIGDVSGKGTQAAFYMTLTKGFVKALAIGDYSPAKVLGKLNRLFYEEAKRNIFISMIYAIFDMKKNELVMARAGHNPLVMYKTDASDLEIFDTQGLAIGLDKGDRFEKLISEKTVSFQSGDSFIFYTDGITEAMDKSRNEFSEDKLYHIVKNITGLNADDTANLIMTEIKKFTKHAPQHDDMTMVVVKVL